MDQDLSRRLAGKRRDGAPPTPRRRPRAERRALTLVAAGLALLALLAALAGPVQRARAPAWPSPTTHHR